MVNGNTVETTVEVANDGPIHIGLLNEISSDLHSLAMRCLPVMAKQFQMQDKEDVAGEIVLQSIITTKKKGLSPEKCVVFLAKTAGNRLIHEISREKSGKDIVSSIDELISEEKEFTKKISIGFVNNDYSIIEIKDFIERQDSRTKRILELKANGYKNHEVAQILGISNSCVTKQLKKACTAYYSEAV